MGKINHNETNIDGLRKLMADRAKLLNEQETKDKQSIAKDNLRGWRATIPEEYRSADLRQFTNEVLNPLRPYFTKKRIPYRTLVYGIPGIGKKYFVYAILKELILQGMIEPSRIKWAEIGEGAQASIGGFQKQDWRDKFFDKNADLLILYGTSKHFSKMNLNGTERFVGELAHFLNANNKPAIFIYDINKEEQDAIRQGSNKWRPMIANSPDTMRELLTSKVSLIQIDPSKIRKRL